MKNEDQFADLQFNQHVLTETQQEETGMAGKVVVIADVQEAINADALTQHHTDFYIVVTKISSVLR